MVDAVGTTVFGYDANGLLGSEDGPWANDTVSYGYTIPLIREPENFQVDHLPPGRQTPE